MKKVKYKMIQKVNLKEKVNGINQLFTYLRTLLNVPT